MLPNAGCPLLAAYWLSQIMVVQGNWKGPNSNVICYQVISLIPDYFHSWVDYEDNKLLYVTR